MNTAVIVQARMGSSRFPGKMCAQLGGLTLIEWVFQRLSKLTRPSQLILATTDLYQDEILCRTAQEVGARVYRGSEHDVLDRYLAAAEEVEATEIVRICGDNPFVDPIEIDRLIDFFERENCDYACNHLDRLGSGYADGFGGEIFSIDVLKDMAKNANDEAQREHVTSYILTNSSRFSCVGLKAPVGLNKPNLRFDVDTEKDLIRLNEFVINGVTIDSRAPEIIAIAEKCESIRSN